MKKSKKIMAIMAINCLSLATLFGCAKKSAAPESTAAAVSEAQTEASKEPLVLTWNEVNAEGDAAAKSAGVFKEKLEELSDGTMTVNIFYSGTLGDEKTSMQALQVGTLDFFRGNATTVPDYGAKMIGVTGLPFIFKDIDHFWAVANSEVGDELLNSVADSNCGYRATGWLLDGPRNLFLTEKAMNSIGNPETFSLANMANLKIRVPETELMINTMKALGASATPLSYSELYTSLQSGVIDGAENGLSGYIGNSFYEVAPYYIKDAHTFGAGLILISNATWDKLTAEQQEWVMEASKEAENYCYDINSQLQKDGYDQLAKTDGVHVMEVSDLSDWSSHCSDMYASYADGAEEMVRKIKEIQP